MKTASATENRPLNSPMVSSRSTAGSGSVSEPPSRERRRYGIPAASSFRAAVSKRSGFRGARISSRSGRRAASCWNARIAASSSSTSPAEEGGMVLAAIHTLPGRARSSKAGTGEPGAAARAAKSYLKLPPVWVRSGIASSARNRSRMASVCARMESAADSTPRKNHRKGK
jgi:hypothetical protein